jgi:hypothetical protein
MKMTPPQAGLLMVLEEVQVMKEPLTRVRLQGEKEHQCL